MQREQKDITNKFGNPILIRLIVRNYNLQDTLQREGIKYSGGIQAALLIS